MQRVRFFSILLLVAAGVLASGRRADADFLVTVSDGTKSQSFHATPADPTTINFNLTGFFDDFDVTGAGITSNRTVPGQSAANITLTADVYRLTTGADKTLTFEVIDTGFTFPNPPTYVMTGAASGTFTNTGGNDALNYQMYADTTNAPAGTNVLGGSVHLADPTGTPNHGGNASFSGVAQPTAFLSPIPYSLYTVTTLTLGGSDPTRGYQREINFNTSLLLAVPEPASFTMAAFGGLICAGSLALRRKRRRD